MFSARRSPTRRAPRPELERGARLASVGIVVAVVLAYSNSFRGAFVFDDLDAIVNNPSVHRLWPLRDALIPPPSEGITTGARPLVNLSVAVNYAISGVEVWSYHAVNLLIHLLAALSLFGLARRTLLLAANDHARLDADVVRRSTGVAFAIALLWSLHPLTTNAVTYIIQRAEAMVGLFYLLTLYLTARSVFSPRPRAWQAAAVITCLAGMATKEVMVTAPVVVLLYLWTFVDGTIRNTLRRHGVFLAALAATWILLAALVIYGKGRGGTVGYGSGLSALDYAAMQLVVVLYYLKLAIWPQPLVLDYGMAIVRDRTQIAVCGAIVASLLGGTLWALWRWRPIGFLCSAFFLILSPTSSIVPILTQPMAEHRMYLPLACVVALLVLAVDALWRRLAALSNSALTRALPAVLLATVAALFGLQTWLRNFDFHDPITLWQDTVAKRPDNERAHRALATQYMNAGDYVSALAHLNLAARINPTSHFAFNDRGALYVKTQDYDKALVDLDQALKLQPGFAEAWTNRAAALIGMERFEEAVENCTLAVRLKPEVAQAYRNRALALHELGRKGEAQADARRYFELGGPSTPLLEQIAAGQP